MDPDDNSNEDRELLARFPLGKTYQFTFKLMVHQLYQVNEWAKTVKEMLEKSKMEFKPLLKQDEEKKVEEEHLDNVASLNKDKSTVSFKVKFSSGGGGWRGSVIRKQQCSLSVFHCFRAKNSSS